MLRVTCPLVFGLISLLAPQANADFFLGAGLGSDTIDFQQRANVYQPGAFGFNVIDKTHLSGTGVFGTIFAGYGYLKNKLYLAAELNANLSSTSFKSSNKEYVHANFSSTQYKIINGYGISLLPGYQYSENTLFYVRMGYINSKLVIRSTEPLIDNKSYLRDGFRVGLGIKQTLTKRVSVRMGYSQAQYVDTTLNLFDSTSFVTKHTIISPRQQLVELAIVVRAD